MSQRCVSDWQCPICRQKLSDVEAALVPCIFSSCQTAAHPICVDCCWELRVRGDFNCPLCRKTAVLILPLHCMVDEENSKAQAKIARAEKETRPAKEQSAVELLVERKNLEYFRIFVQAFAKPILWMIFFFSMLFIVIATCTRLLTGLLTIAIQFCTNPWCFALSILLATLIKSKRDETAPLNASLNTVVGTNVDPRHFPRLLADVEQLLRQQTLGAAENNE